MQNGLLYMWKTLKTPSITKFSALASDSICEHDKIKTFFSIEFYLKLCLMHFFGPKDKSNLARVNSY